MARKINDSILNIRLGAIYRVAVYQKLSREVVTGLLTDRARMTAADAATLCGHWFTTQALRRG